MKMREMAFRKGNNNSQKIKLWRKHNKRILNFAVGTIVLVLGILVLFL
jgi:hypothetical protein